MVKRFYIIWGRTILFWLLFFILHRLIFIFFNADFIKDTQTTNLIKSFFYGGRMDLSIIGYMMMMVIFAQLISLALTRKYSYRFITYFSYILIVIFSGLLLSDTYLFSFWGRHLDAEAMSFLNDPKVVLWSLEWYQSIGFFVSFILVNAFIIYGFGKLVKPLKTIKEKMSWTMFFIQLPTLILLAGILIIPIRGGVGVAPLNTGAAYFSSQRFANMAALNPIWNLMYSYKRLDATKKHYHFMDDKEAEQIFSDLNTESGEFSHLLSIENPNVVIILLESFAGHVIEPLGGHPVTPNFTNLCKEGVLFTNFYAAASRSDKGLVAALAGYQVMPTYSIIRMPDKTETLSFLPKKFDEAGYNDIMYMYGGDMGFKNMNSFVNQAGFKRVIQMFDFPSGYQGEKWGVHDEYTFDRLAEEMNNAQGSYFYFYFTLSSHEPFDVPMEQMFEDKYHNSIAYTDKCLGNFIKKVKENGQWDNTLFILMADHSTPGPERYTDDVKERYHIPMLWTGGALAVKDTIITKVGSQTDMARTLLNQCGINDDGFPFSKNLLDKGVKGYAFFDYPDAMGFVEDSLYQVYDNRMGRFIQMENAQNHIDSLKAKAYLQVLSLDHKRR
nr:sulfatase-like hydrolase/transferase [uncultured Carboxylicivirga sp.]